MRDNNFHAAIVTRLRGLDKLFEMSEYGSMDPKTSVSQLDPKLKEVYERVMGTPTTATATAAPPMPPPLTPQPVQPTSLVTPHTQAIQPSLAGQPKTAASLVANKQKLQMSNVILVVTGVFFFVVYTIFWMRFFNYSIPFFPR